MSNNNNSVNLKGSDSFEYLPDSDVIYLLILFLIGILPFWRLMRGGGRQQEGATRKISDMVQHGLVLDAFRHGSTRI